MLGETAVQGPRRLPETLGSGCVAGWEGGKEISPCL